MSFHKFLSYDPYLSFAEGQQGFQDKVFLRSDGSPCESWHGKNLDGKDYLSTIWRLGRDAYATIARKLGEQPSAEFFEATATEIRALEKELLPTIQTLIERGQLALHEDRDSPALGDLNDIADAPDGWFTEVYMRIIIPCVVSGVIAEAEAPDFESLLLAAAVLYVDDYIIAKQLARGADIAFELVATNIASAKLYRETIDAAKTAVSANGRRSANERHRSTNALKEKALAEWDREGSRYSGMAAFARHRHKIYEVTERTLYSWVQTHRKTKI